MLLAAAAPAITVAAALSHPESGDRVGASAQFTVAFFATILTGEAVIFALAFSATSAWPSLREIDAHIAFREWVVLGWFGTTLLGLGLLAGNQAASTAGAVLFLLADLLGIYSFIRLFGLASAGGRKNMLRRTLELGLSAAAESAPAAGGDEGNRGPISHDVLLAYLREVDGAIANADGNALRDLTDQLVETQPRPVGGQLRVDLHVDVLHRLGKSMLAGRLDAGFGTSCGDLLVGSLLGQLGAGVTAPARAGLSGEEAGARLGELSRYLAWLADAARILAVRQVTSPGTARELIAFSVRGREAITFAVDPDPPGASSAAALGSPLDDPLAVFVWIRQHAEFHGTALSKAFYPVFQLLTGTRFEGNYWDGASVLDELRSALFGTQGQRVATAEAERSRAAFGSLAGFDRAWTLLSIGALATFRDVRVAHPPELIRDGFTPRLPVLNTDLRTFASHRYFETAGGARRALLQLVGHGEDPSSLWTRSDSLLRRCNHLELFPQTVEPTQRIAATVFALACRLAPMRPQDSADELRGFLGGLSEPIVRATWRLTRRTIPAAEGTPASTAADPVRDIVARLDILRLTPAALAAEGWT
jgi:hypothetical protein